MDWGLLDRIKSDWAEIKTARSAVVSLLVIALILGFGSATLLDRGALSGKDATIENLKTQIEGLKSERDDLQKKLDAVPKAQADEASKARRDEAITKLSALVAQGSQIIQAFAEKNDRDLIISQYKEWEPKVLDVLSGLGPAY